MAWSWDGRTSRFMPDWRRSSLSCGSAASHILGNLLGMPSVMQPAQAWAMNDLGEVLCTSGGAQVAPAGSAWIMSPTQRAADLNGDCRVDGSDIGLLLQSWGARGSIAADLDHDGSVDGADLGLLLGAWSGR